MITTRGSCVMCMRSSHTPQSMLDSIDYGIFLCPSCVMLVRQDRHKRAESVGATESVAIPAIRYRGAL
jgi:late competence protein required for DNA uptake (superfamily II DNA/RNA helicase)